MSNPKVSLITGASSGIGSALASELHEKGHKLILLGRNTERLQRVAKDLGSSFIVVDFSELEQVKNAAEQIVVNYPEINYFFNNAGLIGGSRRVTTVDGLEKTLQVNAIAPFALISGMMGSLVGGKATIVNTISGSIQRAGLDLDDLNLEKQYTPLRAYRNSKLVQFYLGEEMDKHWPNLRSVSINPGHVNTHFGTESTLPRRIFAKLPIKHMLTDPSAVAENFMSLLQSSEIHSQGEYYRSGHWEKLASYDNTISGVLWQRANDIIANYVNQADGKNE